jgi:Spy/CpxP family protein refolding chaperone
LIFLTGSAAGALGMRYSLRGQLQKPTPSWREAGKEISLQKFKKELDLTPDQAREIETILDDFVMYYQTLQAQMDEVRASGKERIVKILTPEQREKFGKMMSELQARQIR